MVVNCFKLFLFSKTTSEDCIATPVDPPTEIPTEAIDREGASFIPSPIIAVVSDKERCFIISSFS